MKLEHGSLTAGTLKKQARGKNWIKDYFGGTERTLPEMEYHPTSTDTIKKFKYKGNIIYVQISAEGK